MKNANQGQAPHADDSSALRIGIVQARFNADITNELTRACLDELSLLGIRHTQVVQVPGALEVPLALQALAEQDQFDALIALGCIIRGETYHFELVANESGAGVSRVSLENHMPIANAILTVESMAQAVARQTDKGRDAARVAVEMAHLINAYMDEEQDLSQEQTH